MHVAVTLNGLLLHSLPLCHWAKKNMLLKRPRSWLKHHILSLGLALWLPCFLTVRVQMG